MTTTAPSSSDIEHAIAAVISEQYAHGARPDQVSGLVKQLKAIAGEEHSQLTDKIFPNKKGATIQERKV
jgi:hypothetical protein